MRFAKLLMLSTIVASSALGAAVAGEARAALASPIAPMPLNRALEQFAKQTGLQVVYVSTAASGVESAGAPAGLSRDATLRALLSGTGLQSRFIDENTVTISKPTAAEPMPQMAQAAPVARPTVETVTVTSSKLGGADVQSIPISITALSQEQLTSTQTAGGPDLVKQVPNLTFTKTNFSGYSLQIRGIGTQAISVTTDPAVAVAFNDTPFIRNHFFEQEFFDVSQVEVLRGPQGTLYGRNATAGVMNLTSAKPTDQFEAMASGEIGNYQQRRFEGMVNLPIVDDRLDIRVAGEWTKRQGYSYNSLTDERIDGRDLWSGRVTIGFKPIDHLQAYLVWEHFSEDDDRLRSAKQLCNTAPIPPTIGGVPTPDPTLGGGTFNTAAYLSQGCQEASLYSKDSFQVPNGFALPYYGAISNLGAPVFGNLDPYASTPQSTNLRVIESQLEPSYQAKNDIVELNADYDITPTLTFTSQTGFNHDFLWSSEDYNRFNTAPGVFDANLNIGGASFRPNLLSPDGVFCDPQLGCSDRLLAEDLVKENSWQASQEFRL
ncbi:MAG TPA: TonB-dependent receptor plug domain-containing protein, partial [Rhizomicrobium sp.]